MRLITGAICALSLGLSAAKACDVDETAVYAAYVKLSENYAVSTDIDCDNAADAFPANALICESASYDTLLWRMVELDDAAYVYAYENATARETNHAAPPRDEEFIAARNACTDEACVCDLLVEHTNSSLGGLSPYLGG